MNKPPQNKADPILIGRIGAPYGVRGWVKLYSFTHPESNLLEYHPWIIRIKGHPKSLTLEDAKVHGKGFIAKFAAYDDRNLAMTLTNADIFINPEKLPTPNDGQYYWRDLIGLTVIDQHEQTLGVVESLFSTGSLDIMVVKGETEQLIPYRYGHSVKSVDLKSKIITVEWEQPH